MKLAVPARVADGVLGAIWLRAKEIEIFDRSYQIAAQCFVALIPLVLVAAVAVTGGQQVLASSIIQRFELGGFAAQSVSDLLRSDSGQIYWFGVLLSVYSAFSLSKRVSRAYTTIWRVPPLAITSQWRGLVWIAVQIVMIGMTASLRRVIWHSGPVLAVVAVCGLLAVWFLSEWASQWLLTRGAVARARLLGASALVVVGKVGASIWGMAYLSTAMTRQAELYGPLGVVFSMFTYFLVLAAVMLGATLVVAVATQADVPAAELTEEAELVNPDLER
jgi:membrane protein